jgi:hypothetical protein
MIHGGFKKHIRSCQTTSINGNTSCADRMATTGNPLMSCSIDTKRDNKVHSSEDYSENTIDYQADCDDLFHEGDDDSDYTLDYNTDGEDLHREGEEHITDAQRLPIFKQRQAERGFARSRMVVLLSLVCTNFYW